MQTIQNGYQGATLLFILNWDRLLVLGAVAAGLALGGVLRTF